MEKKFNDTLENYTDTMYKIKLLEGAQPFHARPFPVPKVHKENLKAEVDRLVNIGVFKRNN